MYMHTEVQRLLGVLSLSSTYLACTALRGMYARTGPVLCAPARWSAPVGMCMHTEQARYVLASSRTALALSGRYICTYIYIHIYMYSHTGARVGRGQA